MPLLADPNYWTAPGAAEAGADAMHRFEAHLANAARGVRSLFSGPITYAAAPWEPVDWRVFDYVGLDAYRDASNRNNFAEVLRAQASAGKPLVLTEFGCCTYRGAADKGAMGLAVVDSDLRRAWSAWRFRVYVRRPELPVDG